MADEKKTDSSLARTVRLRNSGLQIEALNASLQAQLALLDDDELAVLESIKSKLNSGLDERLKQAADTVGGFVW
ncbi:MAG: aroma-sacti cluster domain-containing protein [Polyangiales bacterium]